MQASIVIAAHNEDEALARTVESCLDTAQVGDWEIVVADDASTDSSVERVSRRFPLVRVVRQEQRLGAAPTKALGARHARGEILLFLDGHTRPEHGALTRLVQDVERLKGEALVTPTIAPLDVRRWQNDHGQVGHGYRFDLRRFDCQWLPLSSLQRVSAGGGTFYESPALMGCAFALSRDLYERMWGFDAQMRSWGLEDLDLSLKGWLLGARILHDPEAVIGHRFRTHFDTYPVPEEDVLVNQLRTARKNFTQGVWDVWLGETRRQNQGRVNGEPEGIWARAWHLFETGRASAEQERSYLQARRVRDELWYAHHFNLDWPRLYRSPWGDGGGPTPAPLAASPSPPPNYAQRIPIPSGINPGLSAARQSTMLTLLGIPGALTTDCSEPTNAKLLALLAHRNVGPFSVRGLKPALDAWTRVFAAVQATKPGLYAVLTTAGALCCRAVRGSTTNFSNHSWGTAIDMGINGVLVPRGEADTQEGIAELAPLMAAEKFFWGAGYSTTKDSMHFEASDELMHDWHNQGLF